MARRSVTIAIVLTAASVALAGCSGTTPAGPADTAAPSATEPSAPGASSGSSSEPAAEAATRLTAVIGSDENPEAYEIALTDESGAPVTTLPAGDYTVTFVDRSSLHNFRLTGPGDVDVSTDVAGSDESTVSITLVEGTYEFVCEPHASVMNGSVEVTG